MRLFAAVFALLIALPAQGQETIAYWAQNNVPHTFPQPADAGALAGEASLQLDGPAGIESGCIQDFAGTTINALPGFDAGQDLAIQPCAGFVHNGAYIEIAASTAGFEDIVLSWAQRGSGTGFDSRQLSWSADGGANFTDFGSDTEVLTSSWEVQSYNLASIAALNDNPDVVFRVTLDGGSGPGGNNRFDNIRLDGLQATGVSIPYELEFSSDPYAQNWSAQNISGLMPQWEWDSNFGNVTFTAHLGGGACEDDTESWFISPGFNLDETEDQRLWVDIQRGFGGDDNLSLYFSDDYDGQGDPNLATWTLLQEVTPADFSSNNTPVTFGPFFEIQDFEGKGYFAVRGHYTSGSCSTWRVSRFEIDLEPPPPEGFACFADPEDDDFVTRIHDIQGDGFESPLAGPEPGQPGESVQVQAIVTGLFTDTNAGDIGGFFLQEPDQRADNNPLTSEGIYISPEQFSAFVPQLDLGDEVRIYGSVRENFGQTEIFQVSFFRHCESDQLNEVTPVEVELPVDDYLDLESVEGMWVRLPQALAVTEVFNAARFAEFAVAPERLFTPTQVVAPGDDAVALQELNDLSRLIIDEGKDGAYVTPFQPGLDGTPLHASNPIRNGYRIQENFDGIIGFAFSNYRVYSLQPAVFDDAENPRNEDPPTLPEGNLRVASINVENFFTTLDQPGNTCGPNQLGCRGATTEAELERQLAKLTHVVGALDVDLVGLVEVENDDDDSTLQLLVDELNDDDAIGDWDYIATGWSGTDAIKNAIIYRAGKVAPVGDFVLLDSSVDVFPPFDDSRQRPVLTQAFEHIDDGGLFTLSVVHLRSKNCGSNASGFDLDQGDGQGCWNYTRTLSVHSFRNWMETDPTGTGTDRHLVMGDFNAYAQEDPLRVLVDDGWVNQEISANGGDPHVYSYVFMGQSGSLDHSLASPAMDAMVLGAAGWAINADEIPAFGYPETLPSSSLPKPVEFFNDDDPFRASDHDPLVMSLLIEPAQAEILIEDLNYVYDGDPKAATVTVLPDHLDFEVLYDGQSQLPTDAGAYEVVVNIIDPDNHYAGTATATLTIAPAMAAIAFEDLTQLYTGAPLSPTVMTDPAGLAVTLTFDGGPEAIAVGEYQVEAVITDPNHTGAGTALFTILASDAQQLRVVSEPQGVFYAGEVLEPALVVEVLNGAGEVATDDNETVIEVSLLLEVPAGNRAIFASAQVEGGVTVFDGLVVNNPGENYRLLVTDSEGRLNQELAGPFTVLSDPGNGVDTVIFSDRFEFTENE